jgi:ABC-type sugar transport system permease subunit
MKNQENFVSYAYLSPFLIVFTVFLGYPTIYSLFLSFHKTTIYSDWYNVFGTMKFVGIDNYVSLLTSDKEFWWSLCVTGYYALLTIPSSLFVSLLLAVLLSNKFKGTGFFRSAFFLPNVLDMLVVGIIWVSMYGLGSGLLASLGFDSFSHQGILDNPWTVLPAIAFAMVLKGAGFGMVLFLTSIQNIPQAVYEAADIDGASAWHKLRYITIPLVKPIMLFLIITGIMASLNAFTEIYAMTNSTGGPAIEIWGKTARAAKLSGFYLYKNFESGKYGYSAAISYMLLVIALGISFLNLKFIGKGE